jgi:hypothetical protein
MTSYITDDLSHVFENCRYGFKERQEKTTKFGKSIPITKVLSLSKSAKENRFMPCVLGLAGAR